MLKKNDEELEYKNRCLRTLTGKLLFGPAGNRLSADYLDPLPGFTGCLDFIHKMNITELFQITCSLPLGFDQAEAVWYPTYLTMEFESEEVRFIEKKTISSEDVAISVMKWTNCGEKPFSLTFNSNPERFEFPENKKVPDVFTAYAISPMTRFGFKLGIYTGWNFPKEKRKVNPGETVTIFAVAAVGNLAQETEKELQKKLLKYLAGGGNANSIFEKVLKKNWKFYEETPGFQCDDLRMNACWKYRWYILRNCLFRPGIGNFKQAVMYEGRDHRMKKTPFAPYGWEFNKLIPLSSPLQLMDLRWHSDHKMVKEVIRSFFAGQDEDGLLLCTYVNSSKTAYANFILWAIWQFYLIDPDADFIRELLPNMKAYIHGHEKAYMDDKDSLLIEKTHSRTGKEYQPSYWYFHNYPKNPKDPRTFTPLKRVDRSVYHYLNLLGVSNLQKALGEEDACEYEEKAKILKKEINEKMWDSDSHFYYDLHYETEEKAMVKNIVGFYPYWAQIAGKEHEEGILKLMDTEAFNTGSAFPSVSKDCPAFSPDGGWIGNFIKGRNGCVWCGPAWPYTTGIALDGLGKESLRRNHFFDQKFDQFFHEYTIQHFRDGDRHRPYLVEHYNPITGERLSDEADYNHSFWLDLVITYIAGIHILKDCLEVEPLKTHLKWFVLKDLPVRGKKLTVMYSERKKRDKIPEGLTVLADGIQMAHSKERTKLIVKI